MNNNRMISCRYGEFQPNLSIPEIKYFTRHAQERMRERGVTEEMVRRWLPEIILLQSDRKLLIITNYGSYVIDFEGNVVTVIPKNCYYRSFIREIVIVNNRVMLYKH